MNDLYDQLVSALRGIPSLPGALCRGHWQMFDDADDPVVTEAPSSYVSYVRYSTAAANGRTVSLAAPCLAWSQASSASGWRGRGRSNRQGERHERLRHNPLAQAQS